MQVCHFCCKIDKNKTSRPAAVCSPGVVCDLDHLIIWRVCGVLHGDEDDDTDDYKDDVSTI